MSCPWCGLSSSYAAQVFTEYELDTIGARFFCAWTEHTGLKDAVLDETVCRLPLLQAEHILPQFLPGYVSEFLRKRFSLQ